MNFPLIGLHAWCGEFGALMFVWAFIELYSGKVANIRRAHIAVQAGVVLETSSTSSPTSAHPRSTRCGTKCLTALWIACS